MSKVSKLVNVLDQTEPVVELRSTYHDSFGGSGGFIGPVYRLANKDIKKTSLGTPAPSPINMTTSPRLADLESRLTTQERNAQSLLDRAMKIKEDVIENLSLTHSTWQGEKHQRELLQDHIRSISDLVYKLDRDIRTLEDQVRLRDTYVSNANHSMKLLEVQHTSLVSDIRGRVGRCDAAISKLSADQQSYQSSLKQFNSQHHDNYQRLQDKIQVLEVKLAESGRRNDWDGVATQTPRAADESAAGILSLTSKLTNLESKLTSEYETLKRKMTTNKQMEESEREKAISKLSMALDRQEITTRDKLERLEQKLDQALNRMSENLREVKSASKRIGSSSRGNQELERRLTLLIDTAVKQQNDQIARLKSELRLGFGTVHESISSSKQVLEGKLTLSEEQLRKEISHIKKMVVLV